MSNISKSTLFKRQTTLSEIGEEGQQKLQEAKVLIVGCGGLGSPAAIYLAASGIGTIHLVDFDTIDATNLHRQVFFTTNDVGQYKSEVLAKCIAERAPFTTVTFETNPLTKLNAKTLLTAFDVVVDATDSLPTKYLLNDVCVLLNKPLIYGSLYKFDGYVSSFNIQQKDGSFSANLRDAFPEMKTDIPNCEEAGTLNAIVGMIATAQVNEVLKLITKTGKPLANKLNIINALKNTQFSIQLQAKTTIEEIQSIFAKETYTDLACETQNPDWQISSQELQQQFGKSNLEIIAVLPNLELPFEVNQTIPIHQLEVENLEIDFDKKYVLVCQKGLTSYKAVTMIKAKYPKLQVFSLVGGISNY